MLSFLGSESPKYPADEDSSERTTYIPEQYWIDAWWVLRVFVSRSQYFASYLTHDRLDNGFLRKLQDLFYDATQAFDDYYYTSGKKKTLKDTMWVNPKDKDNKRHNMLHYNFLFQQLHLLAGVWWT